ncbi:hypothetical protein B0H19DRAFT_1261366 [Mycena capillaripes]|nr:hypothetical protein B0H19DRAFT_1261366 [Mycena capillaripes]
MLLAPAFPKEIERSIAEHATHYSFSTRVPLMLTSHLSKSGASGFIYWAWYQLLIIEWGLQGGQPYNWEPSVVVTEDTPDRAEQLALQQRAMREIQQQQRDAMANRLSIESALADKIQERERLEAEKEVQERAWHALLVADSMLVTADLHDTIEDLTAEAARLEHTLAEQQVILESLPASIDPNTLDTDELLALLAKRSVTLAKHPYRNGTLNPGAENTLAPMQSQSDGSFHDTLRQLFREAAAVAPPAVREKMAKLALRAAHGETERAVASAIREGLGSLPLSQMSGAPSPHPLGMPSPSPRRPCTPESSDSEARLRRKRPSPNTPGLQRRKCGVPHASRKGGTLADHRSAHRARSSRSSRSSSSCHASPPHSDDEEEDEEVQMLPAAQHRPGAAALTILAQENIDCAAYRSPFNVVCDLQRWASSIAVNTVRPPSTMVSPDRMKITHDGSTLDITAYRSGIQDVLRDLKVDLHKLLYGYDTELNIPDAPVDKWTETERGYSFVNNHDYIPPDSYFSHLLHSSGADLTWTDADGRLHFKLPSVNRHVHQDALFIRKLVVFIASSCTVSRTAEFLEAKMKNSTRRRELFMHLQDLWIVVRRMKWDNLVCHAVFVPHLVPACVRNLLLCYVLIARPALVKLLRVTKEEQTTILYDEYLWVADRQLGLKTLDHRHMQVEIGRLFVNRNLELGIDDNDIGAKQCSHRGSTSTRIYSREDGWLEMLSSDQLLLYRAHCLDWQQGLGLRAGFPPLSSAATEADEGASDQFQEVFSMLENMTATLAGTLHGVGAHLEDNMHKQVARTFMDVLLSQPGLFSALAPPAPPTALTTAAAAPLSAFASAATPSHHEPQDNPVNYDEVVDNDETMVDVSDSAVSDSNTQGQTALQLLRQFLGDPRAVFRSDAQETGTVLSLQRERSFLLCVPTDGGKSLVFTITASIEPHLSTIVMCPNVALLQDQLMHVAGKKLTTEVWTSPSGVGLPNIQVIFVALKTLTSRGFCSAPGHHRGRLSPHVPVHPRACPDGDPDNLLTGTMPLHLINLFWDIVDMPHDTFVVRERFVQPQLAIHWVTLKPTQNRHAFLELLLLFWSSCFPTLLSITLATMAKNIHAVRSFSGHITRERDKKQWMDGKVLWIISTSALMHGVDNRRCVVVIIMDWDPGLIGLAQAWGRVGRQGQPAWVFLIGSTISLQCVSTDNKNDLPCFVPSRTLFASTQPCRRHIFGATFDDNPQDCIALSACPCDLCGPDTPLVKAMLRWAATPLQQPALPPPNPLPPPNRTSVPPSSSEHSLASSGSYTLPSTTSMLPQMASTSALGMAHTPAPRFVPQSANTTSTRSIPLAMQAAYAQARSGSKVAMHVSMVEMVSALKGKCSGCWTSTGAFHNAHWGTTILGCMFKRLMTFSTPVCYYCGLPTKSDLLHPNHPRSCGGNPSLCSFQDLHKLVLYLIHCTDMVWAEVMNSCPAVQTTLLRPQVMTAETSVADFTRWLGLVEEGRHFYRGMEIMVWFWEHRKTM